jgi:ATP-dependent Clp protease ATP-binding subunit ClpA
MDRLARRDIGLEITDAARDLLAEAGYDPAFGARPLKRTIRRLLEDPLARRVIAGEVLPEGGITVDVDGQGLSFYNQATATRDNAG